MRTRYRFENDGTGRRELFARIKVQSEAGVQQWGQVVVGYNSANEKIEIPSVRVLKADGSVVTTPEDSVQDLSARSSAKRRFTRTIGRNTSRFPACVLGKFSSTASLRLSIRL